MSLADPRSPRTDMVMAAVLLLAWALIALATNWDNWPPDLSALFMAGHFWQLGQPELVYAAPEGFFGPGVTSWADELIRLGHADETFFPFVYPPIWAALAAPLTEALSPIAFFRLFYVLQVAMIVASVLLVYRLVRPPVSLAIWSGVSAGLLLISTISVLALYHNQLQITVTFLILLSFERYRAGASIAAGVALGLAAAIKVTPAALGIIFLLDRDVRAVCATAVTGFAMLGLSFLVAGLGLHLVFLDRLFEISGQIAIMNVNWNFEAFFIQLKTLLIGPPLHTEATTPIMAIEEPFWIGLATKIALVVGVSIVLFQTRTLDRADSCWIRLFGLLLVLTLCAPLGWGHHYLPILLLLPSLFRLMPGRQAFLMLALIGGLTSITLFGLLSSVSQTVHMQTMLNVCVMLGLFAVFFVRPPHLITGPVPDKT